MAFFDELNAAAAKNGLRFLVIGAHAVIQHGFLRGTEDADILVCKEDRARWIEAVTEMGYRLRHDGGSFLQFEFADPSRWNLDLMLVPVETFEPLMKGSKPALMDGANVAVPSLEHLLALKIHALKHGKGLRVLKDTTAVVELLRANQVGPQSPWLRKLFEKHGNMEVYERILKLFK